MPIRRKARPGDHLVQDDRTGFTVWASDTQREWNGLRVARRFWEARHPQDFVRGVRDDTRVDDPRMSPDIANYPSSGPRSAVFALAAIAGDWGITINSITNFSVGDWVRVFLDDGNTLQAQVTSAPIRIDSVHVTIDSITLLIDSTETLELSAPLPASAAIGNLIINMSNVIAPTLA